jgi:hypothetical protein
VFRAPVHHRSNPPKHLPPMQSQPDENEDATIRSTSDNSTSNQDNHGTRLADDSNHFANSTRHVMTTNDEMRYDGAPQISKPQSTDSVHGIPTVPTNDPSRKRSYASMSGGADHGLSPFRTTGKRIFATFAQSLSREVMQ